MQNFLNSWDLNINKNTNNESKNLSTKEEIDILKQQMTELKKELNKK